MPKKILIAEDEEFIVKPLVQRISNLGYEVVVAMDGKEVLKKFKKSKPDLIILDIVMPEMNGFAVLEDIKIKQKSKVPVIILSNLDQPQDIEMGKRLGATDYISKANFTLQDLVIKINEILK